MRRVHDEYDDQTNPAGCIENGAFRPHRWTRAEYDRMIEAGVFRPEDRLQLIDGAIIEMSPQGSKHATAVTLIYSTLEDVVDREYHIRVQLPPNLGDFSEPEPDVAVVEIYRDPAGDTYRTKTTLTAADTVALPARPEATVSVADLLP